jgi:hypothetical protein
MKTTININRHIIAANKKLGIRKHPITAQTYKSNIYGSQMDIVDKDGNVVASVCYTPDKPLRCGAVAYVQTQLNVVVNNEQQIKANCNARAQLKRKNNKSKTATKRSSRLCSRI